MATRWILRSLELNSEPPVVRFDDWIDVPIELSFRKRLPVRNSVERSIASSVIRWSMSCVKHDRSFVMNIVQLYLVTIFISDIELCKPCNIFLSSYFIAYVCLTVFHLVADNLDEEGNCLL